ncbi:MAG TPA: glycosyltransferase family 2 protein [Cyclobacteriaceae bacterium]|jgi:glycosyltransferase involved in cell wall biosynthesis|nr:glycosyltransferase family 2 protein [Cyclobacteriaceae bacterium]
MLDLTSDKKPLVTVITVTYNSSAYVRDAIESVLAQGYRNIEYIIGDDCSIDNTWDIIQEYNDQRIRAYRNDINMGEYPNRNRAIGMANGTFIFFIDGDDIVLHRGIEDTVREMMEYPDCHMVVVRPENPKFIGPLRIERRDALMLEFFGNGVLDSSLGNNAYRRDFLQSNLFLTSYKNSDTYSRITFLKHTDLLVLICPIAIWRQSHNQSSKKITIIRQLRERLRFYRDYVLTDGSMMDFVPIAAIKRKYYRLLSRVLFEDLKSFRLKSIRQEYRSFILDEWRSIYSYLKQPEEPEFWREYNYNNLHINFRKKR